MQFNRPLGLVALAFLALTLMTTTVNASVVTFQGGDVGANSTDLRPISNATAVSFDAAASVLGAVNLINFETATLGNFTALTLAAGVTLSGTDFNGSSSGQSVRNSPFGNPENLFGYNTTAGGSRFAFFNGGSLTFTFSTGVQAFGAYFSGLQLTGETITFNDGSNQIIPITNLGSGVQFAGFTDSGKLITSIKLDTAIASNPSGDFVAIDDVRFVSGTSTTVPEPVSFLMLATGLIGILQIRRRNSP